MAVILNIETATAVCSISLGVNGELKACREEMEGRSHSSHLTVFVEQLLKDSCIKFEEIDAISVSRGPGSYTGLRIGVSTAKGLCFSLSRPLIAIDTLKSIAASGLKKSLENEWGKNIKENSKLLFCPMIDARRMEVYSAIYDFDLKLIRGVQADIVGPSSYSDYLGESQVVFFGDGMNKCQEYLGQHNNAIFLDGIFPTSKEMVLLSEKAFKEQDFQDLAYFEPYYLKDFMPAPKKK